MKKAMTCLVAAVVAGGSGVSPLWAETEAAASERKPVEVRVVSSMDGGRQRCLWLAPEDKGTPVPLLVSLHTWSKNYKMPNPVPPKWCAAHNWAYIAPDFRGPNKTPQALGSDYAVQDIVDAVEWAKKNANIDESRIYLIGGSGGGHMALLMAGRHPEIWAGVAAFCPITDIAEIVATQSVPEAWRFAGADADYIQQIHLRKTSGNCRITLFEGAHDILPSQGLNWLSNQRKGIAAKWDIAPLSPEWPKERWGLAK